jgi:hypothetical protein
MTDATAWPTLTLSEWEDTRDTLHMWTQVVGKIALDLRPMVNHWWQTTLHVSSRGLTTELMHAGDRGVEIEFDFVEHVLRVRRTDGAERTIALEPRTVADFFAATMAALEALEISVRIDERPMEVEVAIPFSEDHLHHSYDPDAAQRFWLALVQMHKVFFEFRSRFLGKHSPVHFFWGGFDLATTRFSGHPAPRHPGGVPNCPGWVMEEAESQQNVTVGWWPRSDPPGPAFYAYAYPEPDGFRTAIVRPEGASFDDRYGEFLLSYDTVRSATDPDAAVLQFLQSTYEAGADMGGWDRRALEPAELPGRPPRRPWSLGR